MISLFSGLVAGGLHVLSGPDHLAAIAPLSAHRAGGSWAVGLRWGVGHGAGVVVIGVLSLLFREVLPIHLVSSWAERLVGLVLVSLGIWGIRRALTQRIHIHRHEHGGDVHTHIHLHRTAGADGHGPRSQRHTHAAFAVGTLHGVAGSSHFVGVLPALAFPTTTQAVIYLAAYGLGTVVAMTCFSSAMGLIGRGCALKGPKLYQTWMMGCSVAAVVVGSVWLMLSLSPPAG